MRHEGRIPHTLYPGMNLLGRGIYVFKYPLNNGDSRVHPHVLRPSACKQEKTCESYRWLPVRSPLLERTTQLTSNEYCLLLHLVSPSEATTLLSRSPNSHLHTRLSSNDQPPHPPLRSQRCTSLSLSLFVDICSSSPIGPSRRHLALPLGTTHSEERHARWERLKVHLERRLCGHLRGNQIRQVCCSSGGIDVSEVGHAEYLLYHVACRGVFDRSSTGVVMSETEMIRLMHARSPASWTCRWI